MVAHFTKFKYTINFEFEDLAISLVARSDEYVTMEQFIQMTDMLNLRQTQIQQKFLEVDQKLGVLDQAHGGMITTLQAETEAILSEMGNHQDKMTYLNNEKVSHSVALEGLESTTQQLLGDISGLTAHLMRNVEETSNTLKQADQCVRNLNERLAKVKAADKNKGGTSSSKGLLDPKIMTVGMFDGTKPGEFVGWRDLFEKMVNEYHPGLRAVLRNMRNCKTKINEDEFNRIMIEHNMNVNWQFERVNYELGVYMVSKLLLKPKSAAESVALTGGFEMYRILSQKFDKVTADLESLMISEIAKFSGKQCKDIKELADRLTELEKASEGFQERIGRMPDVSLMGSILTAMLDGQTKREFINQGGLIGNYEAMKNKITEISGDMSTASPMDTSLICLPCEPEINEAAQQRPFNPRIRCWNCNKEGHRAVDCPEKPAAATSAAAPSPGAQNKGGWNHKGAGKGGPGGKGGKYGKGGWTICAAKGGTGKGAYGIEPTEQAQDWWDPQWFPSDDSAIRDCASVEKHIREINCVEVTTSSRYDAIREEQAEAEDGSEDGEQVTVTDPSSSETLPDQEDEDLTGWSVPVTKSKRLRPMRKMKSQPATQPAIVEYEEMPENPKDRIHPGMRSIFSRFQEDQMAEKNMKNLACLERMKEVNMAEKLVGWRMGAHRADR